MKKGKEKRIDKSSLYQHHSLFSVPYCFLQQSWQKQTFVYNNIQCLFLSTNIHCIQKATMILTTFFQYLYILKFLTTFFHLQ